jgi:hypothetical protein
MSCIVWSPDAFGTLGYFVTTSAFRSFIVVSVLHTLCFHILMSV